MQETHSKESCGGGEIMREGGGADYLLMRETVNEPTERSDAQVDFS